MREGFRSSAIDAAVFANSPAARSLGRLVKRELVVKRRQFHLLLIGVFHRRDRSVLDGLAQAFPNVSVGDGATSAAVC
jgi:hypothetical protein